MILVVEFSALLNLKDIAISLLNVQEAQAV